MGSVTARRVTGAGRRRGMVLAGVTMLAVLAGAGAAQAALHGRIVFSADRGGLFRYAIWTARIDGSHARRLTPGSGFLAPAWSPSGRLIAFSVPDTGTHPDAVYVMRADGRHRRRVLKGAFFRDWSPDGRNLVVSRGDDVWTVRPDGTHAHVVGPGDQAAYSPDGRRLAVVVEYEDEFGDPHTRIDVMNSDGTQRRTIVVTGVFPIAGDIAWSPDGRRILYSQWNGSGNSGDLRAVSPSGGAPRLVVHDGESPAFSPDGRHLIFDGTSIRSGGGYDLIYTTDSRGRGRRAVLHGDAWYHVNEDAPDWHR